MLRTIVHLITLFALAGAFSPAAFQPLIRNASGNNSALKAEAVSDAETQESKRVDGDSMFKFYLLEGGMCPYAGEARLAGFVCSSLTSFFLTT